MRPDAVLSLRQAHLRLIAAIAEHGQLGLAAASLTMTQPAASRMLREIEAVMGARLFERHAKGMAPTPVGVAVARRAADMIRQMQDLSLEVARLREGRAGVARVGAVTGASVRCVVPAARRLRAEAPTAELTIQVGPSEQLVRDLLAGAYDFTLSRISPFVDPRDVEAVPARPEIIDIVAAADHPLAGSERAPLAALRDVEWVLQAPGSPIREAVERAFLSAGEPTPQRVTNSSSLLVTLAMLTGGTAVSALSRETARLLTRGAGGGLRALAVEERIVVAPYYLVSVRGRLISALAGRFRALVLEELERDR